MIKKVILTIAAAALFIVPVSIITLQNNTTKTAEASHYSPYSCNNCASNSNQCAKTDFAKLGSYCPTNNYSHLNANDCKTKYFDTKTNSYSSCYPTNYSSNNNTNSSNYSYINSTYSTYSYPNNSNYNYSNYQTCPSSYTTYGCSDMYNTYGYNNHNSGYYNGNNYINEPYSEIYVPTPNQNYVDIYVPQPNYSYPAPSQNVAYSDPYNYNNYNSYEALTTDYVYTSH